MLEKDVSELLNEGIGSYRKALFAVGEFQREMQQRIRNVLDPRLRQRRVEVPTRREPWTLYAHWYVDEENAPGTANVSLWLRRVPREFVRSKLESLDLRGWYIEEGEIGIFAPLEGADANAIDRAFNGAIDRAVALWRKVGGVSQFLGKR
jgi:hypothetical protein